MRRNTAGFRPLEDGARLDFEVDSSFVCGEPFDFQSEFHFQASSRFRSHARREIAHSGIGKTNVGEKSGPDLYLFGPIHLF